MRAQEEARFLDIAGKGLVILMGSYWLFQRYVPEDCATVIRLCSLILKEFGENISLPQLLTVLELSLADVYQPELARTISDLIVRGVIQKRDEIRDDKEKVDLTAALILAALQGDRDQLELFHYFFEKVTHAGLPCDQVYLLLILLIRENPKKYPLLDKELEAIRKKHESYLKELISKLREKGDSLFKNLPEELLPFITHFYAEERITRMGKSSVAHGN